jgi:hypothetical protein
MLLLRVRELGWFLGRDRAVTNLQPRQRSEYVGYGHGDRRVDMSSEANDRAGPGRLQRIILSTCFNPAGPP